MNLKELQNTHLRDITFSIVDTETTGMYAEFNKIMDIGIVTVRNNEILDKWETLIDPEQQIPYWITEFTNLDDYKLRGKPKFADVIEDINRRIENTVFVAHNVGFDYWFLHHEFKRANKAFGLPKLCTVQLSRKLLPHLQYANLDLLAEYYNLKIENRHRALPDAEATAVIFNNLMELAQDKYNVRNFFDLESLQRLNISRDISRRSNVLFN